MTAAGIRRIQAALLAVVMVVVGVAPAGPAQADPGKPPAGCSVLYGLDRDDPSLEWCFRWVKWSGWTVPEPSRGWQVLCSKAKAPDDVDACDVAALTLDAPPADGTLSVLDPAAPHSPANPTDKPLVRCNDFTNRAGSDAPRRAQWTAKHDRCLTNEAYYLAHFYLHPPASDPPPVDKGKNECKTTDIECRIAKAVSDALASGIRSGIQGLVDMTVKATAYLLGEVAKWVFDTTSLGTPDTPFYWTYNQVAGVLLALVLVFFIISTIINGLRLNGPGPLSTVGGLLRAVMGITFAGGIAWLIVRAWDEATATLIDRNSTQQWDPSSWVKAMTELSLGVGTAFLAFVVALAALIGLILLFIMMLFRSVLVTGAALFGSMAMTGQVMPETRSWGRRWCWTVNALASSKFFIAALWIYGSRAAYESNSFMTSLKALLMIWLMVAAPAVLLRLTSMWDGYLSDVNASGVITAIGDAVGASTVTDKISSVAGGGQGTGGSGSGDGAAGIMNGNAAQIPTQPEGDDGVSGALTDSAEAARAVDDGDGEKKFGDVSGAAGAGQSADGGQGGGNDAGTPNADEASGIGEGGDAARHDLTSGEFSAPEGSGAEPGGGASIPMTPPSPPTGGSGDGAEPVGAGHPSTGGGGAGGGGGGAAGAAEIPPVV